MTSGKDFQRSKVYGAEGNVRAVIDMADRTGARTFEACGSTFEIPVEYKFRSLEDVQDYCNKALTSIGWSGKPVEVRAAHGNQSKAHHLGGAIYLPSRAVESWAWREIVVLHELAHFISPAGVAHGPEFCGSLVRLVSEIIGPEVGFLLRLNYLEAGVSIQEHHVP